LLDHGFHQVHDRAKEHAEGRPARIVRGVRDRTGLRGGAGVARRRFVAKNPLMLDDVRPVVFIIPHAGVERLPPEFAITP